jgi:hypothetical protein
VSRRSARSASAGHAKQWPPRPESPLCEPVPASSQIYRAADDLITVNEIADSLARAFDRIEDFEAVQSGRSGEDLLDAVLLLQESVGIGDEARALLRDRLPVGAGTSHPAGHLLLGLIVGLTAAELGTETGR